MALEPPTPTDAAAPIATAIVSMAASDLESTTRLRTSVSAPPATCASTVLPIRLIEAAMPTPTLPPATAAPPEAEAMVDESLPLTVTSAVEPVTRVDISSAVVSLLMKLVEIEPTNALPLPLAPMAAESDLMLAIWVAKTSTCAASVIAEVSTCDNVSLSMEL